MRKTIWQSYLPCKVYSFSINVNSPLPKVYYQDHTVFWQLLLANSLGAASPGSTKISEVNLWTWHWVPRSNYHRVWRSSLVPIHSDNNWSKRATNIKIPKLWPFDTKTIPLLRTLPQLIFVFYIHDSDYPSNKAIQSSSRGGLISEFLYNLLVLVSITVIKGRDNKFTDLINESTCKDDHSDLEYLPPIQLGSILKLNSCPLR